MHYSGIDRDSKLIFASIILCKISCKIELKFLFTPIIDVSVNLQKVKKSVILKQGEKKMNAYEKIDELEAKEFKLITGVTREVFEKMLAVLREEYAKDQVGNGQPGLPVEARLMIALEYWREYRSQRHMAVAHGVSKSTINQAILWVEERLIGREEFKLGELKERFKPEESEIKIIMVDVTEQPIERPVHEQEKPYSGKKTTHDEIPNLSEPREQGDIRRLQRYRHGA
jgi:hypothetical protein